MNIIVSTSKEFEYNIMSMQNYIIFHSVMSHVVEILEVCFRFSTTPKYRLFSIWILSINNNVKLQLQLKHSLCWFVHQDVSVIAHKAGCLPLRKCFCPDLYMFLHPVCSVSHVAPQWHHSSSLSWFHSVELLYNFKLEQQGDLQQLV